MSSRLAVLALLALAGCSPPPIVSAAEAISELRGCEPEALTLEARDDGGWDASSCGERVSYQCSGATCVELEGAQFATDERLQEAREHFASRDADLAACAESLELEGEALIVRARFDAAGLADGLALHPPQAAAGDVRACVARLVMTIEIGAGRELLLSYTVGQGAPAPQPAEELPAVDQPVEEPTEQPIEEPIEEPTDEPEEESEPEEETIGALNTPMPDVLGDE